MQPIPFKVPAVRSLPLVTLALVVLGTIVFALQASDRQAYQRAVEHYYASGLSRIELPRYAGYLERRTDHDALKLLGLIRSSAQPEQSATLVRALENDREFKRDLRDGVVIPSTDPSHTLWLDQRGKFNELLDRVFSERLMLKASAGGVGDGALRLLAHQFLSASAAHWLAGVLLLLVAGPIVEAALGRMRFLLLLIASGVFAGASHILLSDRPLLGSAGAMAGFLAALAILFGIRRIPLLHGLIASDILRVPALLLLPVWAAMEALLWLWRPESPPAYGAYIGGLLAGGVLAFLLRPTDHRKVERLLSGLSDQRPGGQKSTLLQEAQAAAAKLDTHRAARAYGELLQQDPSNAQHAAAYFNMALLGRNREMLLDATLRVLWIRARGARSELRPVYLQMSQPHVLAALPVDEHLRLARRLVATREDAAALRVLDGLLTNDTLKDLYSRQIADCLLGLFTTYSRHGLRQPAEDVRKRLSAHFPSPATIGGLAPSREPPMTIRGATTKSRRGGPSGPPSNMELELDTQLRTRWENE